MDTLAPTLADCLAQVQAERQLRQAAPELAARVLAVKAHQHRRFEQTYADLLAAPTSRPATRFFLDELYGPRDFAQRDAEFERVAPAVVRLFPRDLGLIVAELAQLHALSEQLDTAMGRALSGLPLDERSYARAWRQVGRHSDREQQIRWVCSIGTALDSQVRKPLVRGTLRLMRRPAQAAGLASIHQFLLTGFDAFAALGTALPFLDTIAYRERQLAAALFAGS